MKRFYIHEIDKDHNSWTGSVIMGFSSKKEADKYCKEQSWTGHYYFAEEIANENTVTDAERQFLKYAASLKVECEKTLPRTQHCVLQYVPGQQGKINEIREE